MSRKPWKIIGIVKAHMDKGTNLVHERNSFASLVISWDIYKTPTMS